MLLSPKAKGDAIPSLIVETDNVSASHGGTVGELDEDQVFYMMTRGISRAEAVRMLVEGYFEEVVQRLEDPGLEELVRRRIAEKLAGRRGAGRGVHRGARVMPRPPSRWSTSARTSRSSAREIDGKPLVYLDSAATSQKPRQVIEAIDDYYRAPNAQHPPRRLQSSPRRRPTLFEGARERVAALRRLGRHETTIFTRNATEAINLVAYAWGRAERRARRRGAHHPDGAPLEHRALAAPLPGDAAPRCAT